MAGSLARLSASNDNQNVLDTVGLGAPEHDTTAPNPCPDLCTDFSNRSRLRPKGKSKKRHLSPALIDDLKAGKLDDPETGGLAIEVLASGKKRWRFRRRIAGSGEVVKLSLGLFLAYTIAAAREWANGLNLQIDAGIDPRETAQREVRFATMTVERAHGLYMMAVREGRSSRAKRPNKPRTAGRLSTRVRTREWRQQTPPLPALQAVRSQSLAGVPRALVSSQSSKADPVSGSEANSRRALKPGTRGR